MQELTETFQIDGTPTVIVGGKYKVEFADWESGMNTIDLWRTKYVKNKSRAVGRLKMPSETWFSDGILIGFRT